MTEGFILPAGPTTAPPRKSILERRRTPRTHDPRTSCGAKPSPLKSLTSLRSLGTSNTWPLDSLADDLDSPDMRGLQASGELAFIYLAGFVTLFLAGPGCFSLDAMLSQSNGRSR